MKNLLKKENTHYFKENIELFEFDFVDELFDEYFNNKKYKKLESYKLALDCILANLVVCGRLNKSLVKPDPKYSDKRYITPFWFTKDIFHNIFKILINEDYCIYIIGFKNSTESKRSQLGKYIPTEKLNKLNLQITTKEPGTYLFMNKRVKTNSNKIKGKNKTNKHKKIPVLPPNQDKPLYKKMDRDIRFINDTINKSSVTFKFSNNNNIYKLASTTAELKDVIYLLNNDKKGFEYSIENLLNTTHIKLISKPEVEDKTDIWIEKTINDNTLYMNNEYEFEISKNSLYLKRVFNRNEYRFGGRFYTPVFQSIPSIYRPSILIDGEETVELDYSAHHIRLLYNKDGLDFKGEAYIYAKSDKKHADIRQVHKYIAMIAINAENRKSAISATVDAIKYDRENGKFNSLVPSLKQLGMIYNEFLNYHKPIAKYVGNDVGVTLQRLDSDIMNNILVGLAENGITGLPIHDSVLVKKKHKNLLKNLMISSYNSNPKLNNFDPIIN